ncbi:MAG: helix-turn-helix domain-containing protein [Bdellovibrionales bacterium]
MQSNNALDIKSFTQNFYEVLEVAPDAPHEEIHQAFLRAKQTYSSDSPALYSIFTQEEAEELLRIVEDAYAVLGNPLKRRQYDDKLRATQPAAQTLDSNNNHAPSQNQKKGTDEKKNPGVQDPNIDRTAFGHYTINPAMEDEIKNQQVFDGTFLQKVRLYKNVDLDQLSKASRVGRNYLVAIEENDFHSLPASVFVRGFVAQIARQLNLNEKQVVGSFMKFFKQSREK